MLIVMVLVPVAPWTTVTVVGFAVMTATMGVMAPFVGYTPKPIMGMPSIETGVLGGIIIGDLLNLVPAAFGGWLAEKRK